MADHTTRGNPAFWRGEFREARRHFAQSLTLYAPQHHHSLIRIAVENLQVSSLAYTAWILWWLGYSQQALRKIHEARTLAEKASHPFSLAYAQLFATTLHQLRREAQLVREQAEDLLVLATEYGFAFWIALGTMLQGWALVIHGRGAEGLAQMRQGLDALRATGTELPRTGLLAMFAEGCGTAGEPEEGRTAVAEALVAVEQLGIRAWEAELYRLQGALRLQWSVRGGEVAEVEAEACFRHALAVARCQHAKAWELRAAMSLAHLPLPIMRVG
jgi:predicted ATPase